MKLAATVVIFALVCHLAIGDNTTATNTTSTNTTATNTTSTNTTSTNTTTPPTPAPPVVRVCPVTQYFNGTGCSSCPQGCGKCVLNGKTVSCMECLTNKYLQITNGIGACANCSANCTGCTGPNPENCLTFVASSRLNPIIKNITYCNKDHCQFCNVDGTCNRCSYQYRNNNGTSCDPCTGGCAECPASTSNCTKCLNGYSLTNTSSCAKCTDFCENCNSTGCTLCLPGYDLVGGKCIVHNCTDNCLKCDASHKCTTCKPGFWLNTTGNGTCTSCGVHCLSCSSATACSTCDPAPDANTFVQYTLNSGNCTKCNDVQCTACNATGACTSCKSGYLDANSKCVSCPTGCAQCTANGCTQCVSAAKLIGNGTSAKCTAYSTCQLGQQLDAQGNCTAGTIDNCDYGDATSGTCNECALGYFPDGKVCSPCPVGCNQCTKNSTGYLACTTNHYQGPGFTILPNATSKVDATGYLCRAGCASCAQDVNVTCTSCAPNFLLTQSLIHINAQFCLPYEQCPHPVDISSTALFECFSDNSTHNKDMNKPVAGTVPGSAAKIGMSFIAVIVAALFVF